MFDNQNEQKSVVLHEEKPTPGAEDSKFFRRIVMLGIVVGILVVALVIGGVILSMRESRVAEVYDDGGIPSSSENDGGFLGLQNPGKLTDIEPTTDEDMLEEFNARVKVTPDDVANFERAITNYLTLGDFESLDSYLREQEQTYGGPADEYAQFLEDWSTKFPRLRADTQSAIAVIGKMVDSPSAYFKIFNDPEILAATIAWAPISSKLDAFLDYSALILPPASEGDNIQLTEYEYADSRLVEKINEISEMSSGQYMDVKSYDMEIHGHPVRVTVVRGTTGYWEPWSVQDLGGGLNPTFWNKRSISDSEAGLYYRLDINGLYFLSPPDELPDKAEHPDWFDQDGVYIGPVGGAKTQELAITEAPQEDAPSGEETPAETSAPGETGPETAAAEG